MRISIIKDDPGFINWVHPNIGSKIFLDGVELHHCVTADEEKGFATCVVRDFIVDRTTCDVTYEDKFGDIVIQTPEMQCAEVVNSL